MRGIKFRYTVVRENGHIFHETFPIADIERGYVTSWLTNNHIGGTHNKLFKRQFTGLQDRNDVEIYEGDIVKCIDGGRGCYYQIWYISQVEFDDDISGFTPFVEYDSDCGLNSLPEYFEIIGNIHQHPELLEAP